MSKHGGDISPPSPPGFTPLTADTKTNVDTDIALTQLSLTTDHNTHNTPYHKDQTHPPNHHIRTDELVKATESVPQRILDHKKEEHQRDADH